MSTPDKNPSPDPAANQPDDASLHKIREILVGPTTRAVDDRLDTFRKQIDTVVQKSQQEAGNRLEALEKQLRSGLEQQAKSGAALEQAQRSLELRLDELRKQAAVGYEQIAKVQAETRDWIEHELESIREGLDHQISSLRAEVVDRQSMASLFSEMSLRVASEAGAPHDPGQPGDDFEAMIDQRTKG